TGHRWRRGRRPEHALLAVEPKEGLLLCLRPLRYTLHVIVLRGRAGRIGPGPRAASSHNFVAASTISQAAVRACLTSAGPFRSPQPSRTPPAVLESTPSKSFSLDESSSAASQNSECSKKSATYAGFWRMSRARARQQNPRILDFRPGSIIASSRARP